MDRERRERKRSIGWEALDFFLYTLVTSEGEREKTETL